MNENKINELICEIIHLACQAELVSDDQIKLQALGDIADALASVLPVDNSAARSGVRALPSDGAGARPSAASGCRPRLGSTAADGNEVVYRTPQPVVDFCQSEMQRMEARKARKIRWQTFSTKVDIADMGRTRQNGKVYEIRIQKRKDPKEYEEFYCCVNGHTVLEGSYHCSARMARRMLESAMQALVNTKARNRRMSRLADKRRAGILTPEEELAETVRRQKEG